MKRKILFTQLLSLILILWTTSCKTPANTTPTDNGSEPSNRTRTLGTVRATEDCGFFIEVNIGDVSHSLYPVNLDSKLQVDGMRLKFMYEQTAAKKPEHCPNFEPVKLSDVTPVR